MTTVAFPGSGNRLDFSEEARNRIRDAHQQAAKKLTLDLHAYFLELFPIFEPARTSFIRGEISRFVEIYTPFVREICSAYRRELDERQSDLAACEAACRAIESHVRIESRCKAGFELEGLAEEPKFIDSIRREIACIVKPPAEYTITQDDIDASNLPGGLTQSDVELITQAKRQSVRGRALIEYRLDRCHFPGSARQADLKEPEGGLMGRPVIAVSEPPSPLRSSQKRKSGPKPAAATVKLREALANCSLGPPKKTNLSEYVELLKSKGLPVTDHVWNFPPLPNSWDDALEKQPGALRQKLCRAYRSSS